MGKARRYALVVGVVGLITAVIGLGGALVGYMTSTTEVLGRANDAVNQSKAALANEHAQLCSLHSSNIGMIEGRFAELQANHGLLIKNMRTCLNEKEDSDKGVCATIVCAGAWALSMGQANCIDVATQATQMEHGVRIERGAAIEDKCRVPTSALLAFMAEG